MRPAEKWRPVEFGTLAFGQGITTTPLQIATAMGVVANGGKMMKPHLVQHIQDGTGKTVYESDLKEIDNPISENTSKIMKTLLSAVVKEGGTGKQAASSEYQVAGKTGTAQKVTKGSGEYSKGKYFSSFVGFAPLEDPKVVVFVGIDEPVGVYYGGLVAAPIFREVVEGALHYMEVPSEKTPVVYAVNEPVPATEFPKVEVAEKKEIPKFVSEASGILIPDLKGLTMRQVLKALDNTDVNLKFEGSGYVASQAPLPGSMVKSGGNFKVMFADRK